MKNKTNWGIFLGLFGLYLHSSAAHVPPYRDSGEMVSSVWTLGIMHAPGYPLYVLLGKLFSLLPLGNPVFRINVFSAFAGALAVMVFYQILKKWISPFQAFIAALFFGFSIRFWELCCVPEMYSLGVLWMALIISAAFLLENSFLTFFLFGLGLGIRMDTLLLFPLFVGSFWKGSNWRQWILNAFFTFLGITVFLFLPIRSYQNPWLDWSNPESLEALFNILTRRSYGGTLDLLSLSYARGENFPINFKLYALQFIESFGWWGSILAVLGIFSGFKKSIKLSAFALLGFLITGPLYFYLANMPPNPHSLSIIQAGYLLPDLFLCIFIGWGVAVLLQSVPGKPIIAAVLLLLVGFTANANLPKVSKRENFYVRDFVGNALKSASPNSVLVFHKDVQLFSFWEAQVIDQKRKDLGVLATGLSGSSWYWDMISRWGVNVAPMVSLKDEGGWELLKSQSNSRTLLMGQDCEFVDKNDLKSLPCGLLSQVVRPNEKINRGFPYLLNEFGTFRGRYKYGDSPDFFSSDLIGDLARAYYKQGFQYFLDKDWDKADWFMKKSESLDPTFARPVSDRAYMLFVAGKMPEANFLHKLAVIKNEKLLGMAHDYKSLPDVVSGIKMDLTQAYINYGASSERLGYKPQARDSYEKAIALTRSAQAHYNLAVTYWGEDWIKVIDHLSQVIQIDPQFPQAQKYLVEAQRRVGQK